jgi:hypothetical protein
MKTRITAIYILLLLAGCGDQSKPRVTYVYAYSQKPIKFVAQVQPDGTFSNQVRRGERLDIFTGKVASCTNQSYRIFFQHEGRQYVLPGGGYEFNAYTNSQTVQPNVKVVLGKSVDGERNTTLELEMK